MTLDCREGRRYVYCGVRQYKAKIEQPRMPWDSEIPMPKRSIMNGHRSSSGRPLSFIEQQDVDRLCCAFEQQWREGGRPQIEEFLGKAAAAIRTALVTELVASEVELRQAAGESFTIDEYHQRFPE